MGTTTHVATLTFEEFERLPDQPGKRELLEGELIELPPAIYKHALSSRFLFFRLDAALQSAHARGEASQLGMVHMEVGYELAHRSYIQPDVSVTHAGQDVDEYPKGSPAIAIEIISPSNTVEEMDTKTALYFKHGAIEVWRVHRKARYITVHEPGGHRDLRENDTLTTPLLPGFALSVREILDRES